MAPKRITLTRSLLLSSSPTPSPSFSSHVVILSSGECSSSQRREIPQRISAVRFVPASQLSLLWRTPWTYTAFGRAYASAAEISRREIGVSDELHDDDNDADVEERSEFGDYSDVEDEQRIEDSDEEEEEEDQEPQNQHTAKKKIQTKHSKSQLSEQEGRALNEQITANIVRLVDDHGGHRIVSRNEALILAKGKKLDLVLVDVMGDPPVCKIYDFNKEEYKQELFRKERKKQKGAMVHLSEVKELRFNLKTEPKDLKMKAEQAKEFMNRGYRVKFVAMFKGKPEDEKTRLEEEKMIDAIYPMVEDVATIELGPKVESKKAWVILRHVKFAKKKSPKRESQVSAMEQVGSIKQEDQVYSEPSDFYQEGGGENIMHPQNSSSISNTVPPTQPSAFRSPYQQVQPPPLHDTVEAFSSQMFSPPVHCFPEHSEILQGFGGLQGSERAASPPGGPLPSIPTLRKSVVQGAKIQSSNPGVSPLSASSSQGFEVQSSPLDEVLPQHSYIHPSHTPKIQMVSMPHQSRGILSRKQSPNISLLSEKAIGENPTSRGREISSPNQLSQHSFSPRPPTSLRGPPSNLQGPLLNLSQSSSPMPPVTHMSGPSNLQGPLSNPLPSTSVTSSHQGDSSNLESPLEHFFSSPQPPQHAPSSFRVSNLNPSPVGPSQNVQERYSAPLQGPEGLPSQGVPRYPPPPPKGFNGFPPQGVPRYPAPTLGQPRYMAPLGQPSFQDSQSHPGSQNRQMQGPDFGHQMLSQPRPTLDAAAQEFSQQQNRRLEQGYAAPPNLFGSPQNRQQGPPNLFGSPERPQQGPPNVFGSLQCPQRGPSNLFGSPQGPQQGPPNLFGSPQHPQQVPPNLSGSPQRPQQVPPNLFVSPQRPQQVPANHFGPPQRPQQGPPNLFGPPQPPQQGPPNLFDPPLRPQQGAPNVFGSPQPPPQGSRNVLGSPQSSQQGPPNFIGSPRGPQQGPQSLFGSPLRPQQRSPNVVESPLRPQQGQPHLFESPPHSQQGHPEPSQIQFAHQPVGVRQGPQQGPLRSQQMSSGCSSPIPSHPQETGQSPSHGHQGYFAQQEAGGGQNYWQNRALQGYPPQQNQAPQGQPPQRGFTQKKLAQGGFGFQGNHSQTQASQESPLQARPVVPARPGFRPSWSTHLESQEYSPLFESPSDNS